MNRVLVAAVVTIGAVQAVAWGRLGAVDRENARLRTSLESVERRTADPARAPRPAVRPAVPTRIEPAEVAVASRAIEAESPVQEAEFQRKAQTEKPSLEDCLALDDHQRAWLQTLRNDWNVVRDQVRSSTRTIDAGVTETLEATAGRYEEAFRASLTAEQRKRYAELGYTIFAWINLVGC